MFVYAQEALGIPAGTIRATVLIETYPAAFEMEEILYELREHSSGLNAGRWDYIFSVIKKFRTRGREFLLPDRAQVTMTVPFMHAYPSCSWPPATSVAHMPSVAWPPSFPAGTQWSTRLPSARSRRTRPAKPVWGSTDRGSRTPAWLRCAKAAFTAVFEERPNQLDKLREDVHVTAEQLLDVAATPGEVTEAGLRNNVSVSIQYLASWLHGTGAVAIFNLMEDTATAEISRWQVWQWLHNDIVLADTAQVVSRELVERIVDEEIAKLPGRPGDYAQARATFVDVAIADDFAEFLTLPAYERMP